MKKSLLIIFIAFTLLFSACSAGEKTTDSTSQSFSTEVVAVPQYPKDQIFEHRSNRTNIYYGLKESDILKLPNVLNEYNRKDAPLNIEFEFKGITYTLEYQESLKFMYYGVEVDKYANIDSGISVYVDVNTGKIRRFFVTLTKDESTPNTSDFTELSQDECLNKVNEFLSKYVDDLSDYTLILSENSSNRYRFKFAYLINGVITSDTLEVEITKAGDIFYFLGFNPGHMKDAMLLSSEKMEELENKLFEFMESVYEGYVYEYQNEVQNTTFVKLYNGQYAVMYDVVYKARHSIDDPPIEEVSRTLNGYIVIVG